jgi:chloride channel protein, CIC family
MTTLPGNTGLTESTTPASGGVRARTTRPERARRALGEAVLHAPQTLRALVRADEVWLVVLAGVIGAIAGAVVAAMNTVTQLAHTVLYQLPPGEGVSGMVSVNPVSALVVPVAGGLLLGIVGLAVARWWTRRSVDPIEANALYGGQMSVNDSLIVSGQIMISNGCGASVGLEAAFAQIGGAIASKFGRSFRVRRSDLRVLVGCGAGAAIAADFNAPFTGAFYGFELIIGTYTLATLAPVMTAALTGVFVMRLLTGGGEPIAVSVPGMIQAVDYVPILALGMISALVGIAIMRGVTMVEEMFRRSGVPSWLRPAVGGLFVGGLALISPAVLSSGHTAVRLGLNAPYGLSHLALLLVLKSAASAISLGSGFRGGLFFASLFLGALLGKLFGGLLATVTVVQALPTVVCAVVGMSGVAVAIVGGPLTMSFLALESTGSLPLTVAVLAAAVISTLTVRRTFGYSFATWRFHLRGEGIRSAVDIGWMRNLTVGRMMRREIRIVRGDMPLAAFRREFPLGSASRVVTMDEAGRYAGIVQVSDAHAADDTVTRVSELVHHPRTALLPQMTIKEAVAMFEAAESDALAVVDSAETQKVIGLLTEQHALRRYSEELERRRRELSGE